MLNPAKHYTTSSEEGASEAGILPAKTNKTETAIVVSPRLWLFVCLG